MIYIVCNLNMVKFIELLLGIYCLGRFCQIKDLTVEYLQKNNRSELERIDQEKHIDFMNMLRGFVINQVADVHLHFYWKLLYLRSFSFIPPFAYILLIDLI